MQNLKCSAAWSEVVEEQSVLAKKEEEEEGRRRRLDGDGQEKEKREKASVPFWLRLQFLLHVEACSSSLRWTFVLVNSAAGNICGKKKREEKKK